MDLERDTGQIVAALFRKLGPDFYHDTAINGGVFGITERAPSGKRWPDGQKFRQHGRVSGHQLRMIVTTSPTQDEAVDRLKLLLIDGIDTTKAQNDANIEQRVQAEVRRILGELSKKAEMERAGVEQQAEAVVAKPRQRVSTPVEPGSFEPNDEERMWIERAKALGAKEPKITGAGRVDGRWLKRVKEIWQAAQVAPS